MKLVYKVAEGKKVMMEMQDQQDPLETKVLLEIKVLEGIKDILENLV